METIFDHERLDVYQVARQFNRALQPLLSSLPRGNGESKNNLGRASRSMTRNIAEGSGRWLGPDKIKFYRIARASATESAASLDELVDLGLIVEEEVIELKHLLGRIVVMLNSMIRSVEGREDY